jgi:hypothetical protein
VDAETLERDGVDVSVRAPGDDRGDAVVRPGEERHHDVLPVPHAKNQRYPRIDPAIRIARGGPMRMDFEPVREAHEAQVGCSQAAEDALHGGMTEETLTEAHVTPEAEETPPPAQFRIKIDRAWSSPHA